MSKPPWVRVLAQLAMPIIIVGVMALAGLAYVHVAYAITSGFDPIKENGVDYIYQLCILVGAGALVAALTRWWLGRPWDGLGGVALFSLALGGVAWIEQSLRRDGDGGHTVPMILAMAAPLAGCALTAWLLERGHPSREDKQGDLPPSPPARPGPQ
ncbi:MAG: hypothetical protein KKI08_01955 [Armatimonadetes bacterium]|nr:hypothetical protein [Armatimonadota bacterium]